MDAEMAEGTDVNHQTNPYRNLALGNIVETGQPNGQVDRASLNQAAQAIVEAVMSQPGSEIELVKLVKDGLNQAHQYEMGSAFFAMEFLLRHLANKSSANLPR